MRGLTYRYSAEILDRTPLHRCTGRLSLETSRGGSDPGGAGVGGVPVTGIVP